MNWEFSINRWAEVLNAADPEQVEAARQLTGLSSTCITTWKLKHKNGTYERPGMQNFLTFCNLLDLDPRDFFELAD